MQKLIANERAYETLAAYLCGGRLPHALLIEGPRGCGKKTFAAEIAQGALCTAAAGLRPCGVCRHCIKAEKGVHPDILVYGGEGGARSFHIDVVRTIRQQAFVQPNEAEGKVLILGDVQEMSIQAQNALLKIIEEPPRGVTFVLTCENKAALLETILSRVAVIELGLPTSKQCAETLATLLPDTGEDARSAAAHRSGGNIGKALALLGGEDTDGDIAGEILYNMTIGDELAALAALAAYERNRQGFTALLERMGAQLSEEMLRPVGDGKLTALIPRVGTLRLLQILDILEDTARAVSGNVNGLLLVTSLSGRIRSVLAGD